MLAHGPSGMRLLALPRPLVAAALHKLLYAARSETFNPSSTARLVDEIAVEIADDLEKKGVLSPERHGR